MVNTIRGIKKATREYGKRKVDGIIILGGDDLSEYYTGWKIILELYRLKKLSRALKVFLAGQTTGPFTSWRVLAARHCPKRADTCRGLKYILADSAYHSNQFYCYIFEKTGLIPVIDTNRRRGLDTEKQRQFRWLAIGLKKLHSMRYKLR